MLLLVFTCLRVLVLEDEVDLRLSAAGTLVEIRLSYLVGRTTLVRTKHDHVGRSIGELLSMQLLIVLQQLHICTTALEAILKLDLVLHHQSLAFIVDFLGEFRRDGMVSSRVLNNKTLVP